MKIPTNPTLGERMEASNARISKIEDWMESCQRPAANVFITEGTRTGRWTAKGSSQPAVEEVLTEKNAEARFGKTILELANEQLRSDSDHWAQKAHVYRDQVATQHAEIKEYKDRNFKQFQEMKRLKAKEADTASTNERLLRSRSSALDDLEELQNKTDEAQAQAAQYLKEWRQVRDDHAELETTIRILKDRPSAWAEQKEAENTINSLKYQNKQGVNIRKDLEVQLKDRDTVTDLQSKVLSKQLKTMTEQAGTIDRLERLAKKHADTIQRYVAHLDDADSVIEEQIKTIGSLPSYEVHILVYKYTTQYQCQVAGVFSSRDLMEDWLKENPAARDEETEVYTYTINEGEL